MSQMLNPTEWLNHPSFQNVSLQWVQGKKPLITAVLFPPLLADLTILKLALSTTGHVGTWVIDPNAMPRFAHHASQTGDLASTLAGAILSGQAGSMNEESPLL